MSKLQPLFHSKLPALVEMQKIALGVGIGVAIPLAVTVLVIAFFLWRGKAGRKQKVGCSWGLSRGAWLAPYFPFASYLAS